MSIFGVPLNVTTPELTVAVNQVISAPVGLIKFTFVASPPSVYRIGVIDSPSHRFWLLFELSKRSSLSAFTVICPVIGEPTQFVLVSRGMIS